jgi:hypothetical protein
VTPVRAEGKFRLYFNRHGAAPLVWCVSCPDGAWVIAVKGYCISSELWSAYTLKHTPGDEGGKPSAWLETIGQLEIRDGIACINKIEKKGSP